MALTYLLHNQCLQCICGVHTRIRNKTKCSVYLTSAISLADTPAAAAEVSYRKWAAIIALPMRAM